MCDVVSICEQERQKLSARAKSMGRPQATYDIVKDLAKLIENRKYGLAPMVA